MKAQVGNTPLFCTLLDFLLMSTQHFCFLLLSRFSDLRKALLIFFHLPFFLLAARGPLEQITQIFLNYPPLDLISPLGHFTFLSLAIKDD